MFSRESKVLSLPMAIGICTFLIHHSRPIAIGITIGFTSKLINKGWCCKTFTLGSSPGFCLGDWAFTSTFIQSKTIWFDKYCPQMTSAVPKRAVIFRKINIPGPNCLWHNCILAVNLFKKKWNIFCLDCGGREGGSLAEDADAGKHVYFAQRGGSR